MNDLEFGSFNFTNILTYVQTKKTHPLISTYFWSWIHKSSSTFVLTKYFLDFWFIIKCVQVYLCQKLFFLKNMGENMLCTKIVLNVWNNFCTQHVLPSFELGIVMYWTSNSMNNLTSYCGLVDAKIRASDKDLPVNSNHLRARAMSKNTAD